MSSANLPPGQSGGHQDQPPPHGRQYGQPYGGAGDPHGQPGGPQQPPPPQQQPGPWSHDPYADYSAYAAYQELKRPGTVLGGVIMTYIGGGVTLFLGLLSIIVGAVAGPVLARNPQFASMPTDAVQAVAIISGIIAAVIGIALIALTVFAQKGSNAARITLTVIGAIIVLLSLYSIATGGYANIVPVAYILVALILFWIGGANNWYRAKKEARSV